MGTSRLTQGQMTVGIGGIGPIISLFLSWVSFLGLSASAFDAFSGMDLVMLVIGLVAVTFALGAAIGFGGLRGDAGAGRSRSWPR